MLTLAYGSLSFAVDAPGEGAPALGWLAGFLGPAFEPIRPEDAPDEPDAAVALDLDRPGFAALHEAPVPAGAGEVDCFTLDGEFRRYPAWPVDGGARLIRDERSRVFYLPSGRAVTIRAAADAPLARLALMRVVREVATARALRCGHLHVHAAAVEVGGRAVAFAGPRRSGKSSLLLHALLSGGARFLANDRLFVAVDRDPPAARAMPTIVSIRDETLERFPDFAARLEASGLAWCGPGAAAIPLPATIKRPGLAPRQLCDLAGVEMSGAGPLAAIVFPGVAAGVARFELRALPPVEAVRRLMKSLLLASLPERTAAAFDGAEPPFRRDAAALEALCAGLAERVPCLDLRLGAGAYDGPEGAWDAIRARLP